MADVAVQNGSGIHALGNEHLRLRLLPSIGGSVLGLSAYFRGGWVDVMRPAPVPLTNVEDVASFVLVPYSNRVRDGCFEFAGQRYRLRDHGCHALHGDARNRPWVLTSSDACQAQLRFASRSHPDFNFPFPFLATLRYSLRRNVFRSELRIFNDGPCDMPAGGGFHPYFLRRLTPDGGEATLELGASGMYPTGDCPLPIGPAVTLPERYDFAKARSLDVPLDHCFSGWNGRAHIVWPEGVSIRMRANASCEHVVVYAPRQGTSFAVEPVTHAVDALNSHARGEPGTGMVILSPGGTLEVAYELTVECS